MLVIDRMKQRLACEEGFTLIELLVVIVIIGILLAIAVPSYLGFRDRANQSAALADVRAAVPSAEAYFADNATAPQSYQAMDVAALVAIDPNTKLQTQANNGVSVKPVSFDQYCLSMKVGNKYAAVQRGSVAGAAANGGDPKSGMKCD